MIRKITISTLLIGFSSMAMAEEAVTQQAQSADVPATQMETMQIRATAPSKPAVPANVPNTVESVTAKQIQESANTVTTSGALQYLPSVHVRERYIGDRNGILVMRANSAIASAQTIVYADNLLLSNFLNNSLVRHHAGVWCRSTKLSGLILCTDLFLRFTQATRWVAC